MYICVNDIDVVYNYYITFIFHFFNCYMNKNYYE